MNPSDLSGKYVYLAGPYKNGVQGENARRSVIIADRLMGDGILVFNPLLSHWHAKYSGRQGEWWYAYDLKWLERCEYLIYLPGPSKGVELEIRHAVTMGIPVYEIGEILPDWEGILEGK